MSRKKQLATTFTGTQELLTLTAKKTHIVFISTGNWYGNRDFKLYTMIRTIEKFALKINFIGHGDKR